MGEKNKKFAIVGVTSILLVAAVIGTVTYGVTRKNGEDAGSQTVSTSSKAAHSICQYTDYKETCENSLANAGDSDDPTHLAQVAFQAAIEGVKEVIANSTLLKEAAKDPKTSQAFEVCKEVLDDSIDDLERSIEKIGSFDKANFDMFINDLTTWLSGAATFQETCLDAFENTTGDTKEKMKELMKTTTELTSNGLAIVTQLGKVLSGLQIPGFNNRLLEEDYGGDYYNHNNKLKDHIKGHGEGRSARSLLEEDYGGDYNHNNKFKDGVKGKGKGKSGRSLLEEDYGGDYYNHNNKFKDSGKGKGKGKSGRSLLEEDYGGDDYNHNNKFKDGKGKGKSGRSLLEEDYGGDDYNHNNKFKDGKGKGKSGRSLLEEDYGGDYYNHNNKFKDGVKGKGKGKSGRSLLEVEDNYVSLNRHLLQADPSTLKPNAVVALDGSGQFKSIQEAVNTAPLKVNQTFIILVKAGVYHEYVEIPKKVYNVMLIGEGPTTTRITGNKNVIDGTATFQSATVAVNGDNFIARDIGIENTAGAIKHQAVALRVTADRCIFYNCHIDGYQDTLYTHNHRQFYRDCTISGTIDFIFGDAAAVFQNCKLVVRKPLENQACMVTAQGRKESRGKGAIVLQNCTITAEEAFLATKPMPEAFLGRPWKEYSRTIVMQSYIDNIIVPAGWSEWAGTFALDTLSYAEYENRGPGSDTASRVQWQGIKTLTPEQAASFTAGSYIDGHDWIEGTTLPYESGMITV